jgi:hypothetical protein
MPTIPITPQKPGPFRPHVTPGQQRTPSPPPDVDHDSENIPEMLIPSGLSLIIRNILNPTDKRSFVDPTKEVTAAMQAVIALKCDDFDELATTPLHITPGGGLYDSDRASAYIELSPEFIALDDSGVPRSDILTIWAQALQTVCPAWEIAWTPQKMGKDKRMWVKIRVAEDQDSVPMGAVKTVRKWLASKHHLTTGGFPSVNGFITIVFADTNSVDNLVTAYYDCQICRWCQTPSLSLQTKRNPQSFRDVYIWHVMAVLDRYQSDSTTCSCDFRISIHYGCPGRPSQTETWNHMTQQDNMQAISEWPSTKNQTIHHPEQHTTVNHCMLIMAV